MSICINKKKTNMLQFAFYFAQIFLRSKIIFWNSKISFEVRFCQNPKGVWSDARWAMKCGYKYVAKKGYIPKRLFWIFFPFYPDVDGLRWINKREKLFILARETKKTNKNKSRYFYSIIMTILVHSYSLINFFTNLNLNFSEIPNI